MKSERPQLAINPNKPLHAAPIKNFINKNKMQASSFVRRIGVNNIDYFSSYAQQNKNNNPNLSNNKNKSQMNLAANADDEFIVSRPLNFNKTLNNLNNTNSSIDTDINNLNNSNNNIYKNPISFFNNINYSSNNQNAHNVSFKSISSNATNSTLSNNLINHSNSNPNSYLSILDQKNLKLKRNILLNNNENINLNNQTKLNGKLTSNNSNESQQPGIGKNGLNLPQVKQIERNVSIF